jgi:hypothetical protein
LACFLGDHNVSTLKGRPKRQCAPNMPAHSWPLRHITLECVFIQTFCPPFSFHVWDIHLGLHTLCPLGYWSLVPNICIEIQAHKVRGNKRNSLPARTKKYWFLTVAIQEGDVGEPILTQLPNLHEKKVSVHCVG